MSRPHFKAFFRMPTDFSSWLNQLKYFETTKRLTSKVESGGFLFFNQHLATGVQPCTLGIPRERKAFLRITDDSSEWFPFPKIMLTKQLNNETRGDVCEDVQHKAITFKRVQWPTSFASWEDRARRTQYVKRWNRMCVSTGYPSLVYKRYVWGIS